MAEDDIGELPPLADDPTTTTKWPLTTEPDFIPAPLVAATDTETLANEVAVLEVAFTKLEYLDVRTRFWFVFTMISFLMHTDNATRSGDNVRLDW